MSLYTQDDGPKVDQNKKIVFLAESSTKLSLEKHSEAGNKSHIMKYKLVLLTESMEKCIVLKDNLITFRSI